ncbi:hypothetical protein BH10ACI3_BH10ACI3_05500 [soil metagenome]
MRLKPGKKLLFRLLTGAMGLIIGVFVIEIGLRLIDYSNPEFYSVDEILGYSLTPNASGRYRKEGLSFVQINSDGFRDVEHAVEKPAGVYRIALVGDSYVEGLQVSRDEMFSNFVGAVVGRCRAPDSQRVEILNFGVSGYGTAQELLLMRQKAWKYSPDLVLLVMTTNNDISDNIRVFKRTSVPYFVLQNGELSLDDSFRQERSFTAKNSGLSRAGTWLKQNLRFVQGVGEATVKAKYWYNDVRTSRAPGAAEGGPPAAAPVADVGIDNQVYRTPADDNWNTAWNVTEALISQIRKETEANGAKFAVVTGSNGVQVLPAVEQRAAYAKYLGVNDLLYPDRRIAEYCRSKGISVITLAPELGEYAAANNVFLHGFEGNLGYGHWNQVGHRVAGEAIGRHLCEEVIR